MGYNKNSLWAKVADKSEDLVVDTLKSYKGVLNAYKHPMNDLTGKECQVFQWNFGDVAYYKNDGTMKTVEVKTDKHTHRTGNIGLEMWARWVGEHSHGNQEGWWKRKSNYDVLFYICLHLNKAVIITDVNACKQWCKENPEHFTELTTSAAVRKREGKTSISHYINYETFVKECPHAKLIDFNTKAIEDIYEEHTTV